MTLTTKFHLVLWVGVRGGIPPPTYGFTAWCVIKHKVADSFIYAIRFNRWERSNCLVMRCAFVRSCRRLSHLRGNMLPPSFVVEGYVSSLLLD